MTKRKVQKEFSIGSEWLYYKLYCGERTVDDVLVNIIKPFTDQLIEEKLIDKWFFIRYNDPESHLRIRIHLNSVKHIGSIIIKFHEIVLPLINNGLIWKLQTDTYKRELKRYGSNTIEEIESLFYLNSIKVVNILNNINSDEERLHFALKITNEILTNFNFEIEQKLAFSEHLKLAFRKEFNANKMTTKQLNTLYKNINNNFTILNRGSEIYNNLIEKDKKNTLQVPLKAIAASIIHMSINRLFKSKPRYYELVVYDFLSKYYRTQIAKQYV